MSKKDLLRKKFSEVSSLNEPYEGSRRQTPSNEDFERYIVNCVKDLKDTGKTFCISLDQVKELLNRFGSENLVYKLVDYDGIYYYNVESKRYVICLNKNKEVRIPLTSTIKPLKVIRYESL